MVNATLRLDQALNNLDTLQSESVNKVKQVADVYLIEALIAHEHMRSKRLEDTNWHNIIAHYETWLALSHSPVVAISYGVALAHNGEFDKAFGVIEQYSKHKSLLKQFKLSAAFAYIWGLRGEIPKAKTHLAEAKQLGMKNHEYDSLKKQVDCFAEKYAQ